MCPETQANGDGNAGLDWPHCSHRTPGTPALSILLAAEESQAPRWS